VPRFLTCRSRGRDKVSAPANPEFPGALESTLPLTVIAGSLEADPEGLRFECGQGDKTIHCGIVDTALHDLIGFHRITKTGDPLRVLLPEIERLVNAKYDAGRFDEDGWIVVRSVDLLRFGFRARTQSAA
jgi:hypothetical protein